MTIHIEWQDQHGNWQHYQSKQNQADAYRVAKRRAGSTKRRHRLSDGGDVLPAVDVDLAEVVAVPLRPGRQHYLVFAELQDCR